MWVPRVGRQQGAHHGCMNVVERSVPWFFSICGDRQGLSCLYLFPLRFTSSPSLLQIQQHFRFTVSFSSPWLSHKIRYHENRRLMSGQMPIVPPTHVVVRIRGPSDCDPRDSVRRRPDRARVADCFQQRYGGRIRSRNSSVATDPSVSSESEVTSMQQFDLQYQGLQRIPPKVCQPKT